MFEHFVPFCRARACTVAVNFYIIMSE